MNPAAKCQATDLKEADKENDLIKESLAKVRLFYRNNYFYLILINVYSPNAVDTGRFFRSELPARLTLANP